MADTDTVHQEKVADDDVKGFKNDGSFLEQFRKLQDQTKAEVPSEKQQAPVRSIPVKLHVCALKKPTSRVLPKKTLQAKKAFDEDEEEPNTESGKEAAPTVCGSSFSAAEGRLAAEASVEASEPKEGTRKRKSRWSEPPPAPTAILGTGSVSYTPNTSSTELSEAQRQQLLEQIEINRIVAEIRAARQKRGNNKYDYDSDEDVQDGTWEHKMRAREMIETEDKAKLLTETAKGKHHIGDFLPPDELEKFIEKVHAKKEGREADISDYKTHKLTDDNIGYKMLQKAGWKEGSGLGTSGAGIMAPINKGRQSFDQSGLGTEQPGEVEKNDDAFETYRKRMMLAYRFRPNPLNNPRRPYY